MFHNHQNFHLKLQLSHYELDIRKHPDYPLSKLCSGLAISSKSKIYHLTYANIHIFRICYVRGLAISRKSEFQQVG